MRPFLNRCVAAAGCVWICLAMGMSSPFALPKYATSSGQVAFPFRINDPDTVFTLPKELNEISGLTALDGSLVAAVQDERGSVFVIDISTASVVQSVRFGGRGDYEGIERVGNVLYVLESNGDLFEFRPSAGIDTWPTAPRARRIRTRLSSRYDAEGLGFDPETGRLLIACKEYPGKRLGKNRAIYAFDPYVEEVAEKPIYLVNPASVEAVLENGTIAYNRFKPSALGIHPETGHVFMLSSRDRFILEINRSGEVISAARIERKDIQQPEGITFLSDGRMVIASEAGGRDPTITVFSPVVSMQ